MHKKTLLKITMLSFIASNLIYASETKQLDSVTVTANKIEENIQDVPQSITVIDEEILKEKNIDSISKVIDEIPNMDAVQENAFGTNVNFRGLNTSLFTNNNPVVIYIDGVPTTDRYSYQASLTNAKRVEVLRGPQGTLYGKDAIGAVINIVTNDTPETLTGSIGAEYGSNNYMKTDLNISAPLIDDKLYGGINGSFKKDDGWVTNTYNNDDKAAKGEEKNINLYLKYKATDRLDMKISLSKEQREDYFIDGGSVDSSIPINDISRDDFENVSFDFPTYDDIDINAQSLSLNYMFDDFDLNFVSTRRNAKVDGIYDSDYSDVATSLGLSQFNDNDTTTYTNELRLSNNDGDIRWVAGLYYDDEKREQGPYGYESYYYGATYYSNVDSVTDSNTKAIFGQTMIPFAENFELTLGGRYQQIEKEIDASAESTWGGAPFSAFDLNGKKDWNVFLPKVALAYKPNEDLTTFASISKGYMPGGFNYFPASSNVDDNTFDPQQSINYEVGLKGLVGDLSYTASIFYMDIKDIHVYTNDGFNWYTSNAKKAHSYGLELEGTYFLSDTIDISSSLGLIKAKYDDYDGGSVTYDGEKVQNTPTHTASVTLNYKNPNGFYGFLNIQNRGKTNFYDSVNSKFTEADGYTIGNVKIGYKFSDWDIYAYINNITDEEYITTYISKSDLSVAAFNEPRFIGIGARYSF